MKIIGMIHLGTLPGSKGHKGIDDVKKKALKDMNRLLAGGVDEILVENTEDHPHTEKLNDETVRAFTKIVKEIVKKTRIPIGICPLWNDYSAGLRIAVESGASFIRVPVFVDKFKTEAGIIVGNADDVISFRKKIGAENVKLMTDIHVKHAVMLNKRKIEDSAKEALEKGADELIITGKFTGDAPKINDLKRVRKAFPNAKIAVGSGTTPKNIKEIMRYADTTIVGTYLKTNNMIDVKKVKKIMRL